MKSIWIYKLEQSIRKRRERFGVVLQDNLSLEKHIDEIFHVTFMMLRIIRMAFHFIDKDMMRKKIILMIRPKKEI